MLALFLVAAILAGTAWATWRTLHVHGHRLEPHRAVNRLVLAKACALVGALAAGGYAGYALSWVGMAAELADQRMVRSGIAALGGLLTCGAALLLERACRVAAPGGRRVAPHGRPEASVFPRSWLAGVGNMRHRTHIVTRVSRPFGGRAALT